MLILARKLEKKKQEKNQHLFIHLLQQTFKFTFNHLKGTTKKSQPWIYILCPCRPQRIWEQGLARHTEITGTSTSGFKQLLGLRVHRDDSRLILWRARTRMHGRKSKRADGQSGAGRYLSRSGGDRCRGGKWDRMDGPEQRDKCR